MERVDAVELVCWVALVEVFWEIEDGGWMCGKVGVRVEEVVMGVEPGWMLVELGPVFSKAALDSGPPHLN